MRAITRGASRRASASRQADSLFTQSRKPASSPRASARKRLSPTCKSAAAISTSGETGFTPLSVRRGAPSDVQEPHDVQCTNCGHDHALHHANGCDGNLDAEQAYWKAF